MEIVDGIAIQQETMVGFKSHSGCHGEYRWNGEEPGDVDDLDCHWEESLVCILKTEPILSCLSGL